MTYEYVCTACAHEWEASQPISDPALTTCPNCGKETAKRQISGGTGFVLKGGGWYADLYSSSGGGAKSADKSVDGSSSSGKSTSAKTETKTETKKPDSPTKSSAPKASSD